MKYLAMLLAVIIMTVDVTAYTPHELGGSRRTTSGAECVEGITCALNGVPFGSKVEWNGHIYTVQDRCGYNHTLDLFVESLDRAYGIGRQRNQQIVVTTP